MILLLSRYHSSSVELALLSFPVHVASMNLLVDEPDAPGNEAEAAQSADDNYESNDALELAMGVLLGLGSSKVSQSSDSLVLQVKLLLGHVETNTVLTEERKTESNV